jgi:hypothetical protein
MCDLGIFLERLEKTMNIMSQDRDSNRAPPKYKTQIVPPVIIVMMMVIIIIISCITSPNIVVACVGLRATLRDVSGSDSFPDTGYSD